ncbi:hypothetical protein AVEN_141556-1 [Araneus ventricosus]|uniref:Uncharacterized protein n=1 Tax=Araneus ventricosus TaxID=182803 RepID=A0A4Y2PMQ7_ARAVE|nr:hypothetical protein AVEN_141556-1 [Araneus ventricosus]
MEFQAAAIFLFVVLSQCISAQLFHDGLLSKMECIEGAFWQFGDSPLFEGNNHNTASLLQNEKWNDSLKLNGTTSASEEDCYFNEVRASFFPCPSRVEEDYDVNRVPQVMSTVRCLQTRVSNDLLRPIVSHCEEVNLQVPVLRKNNNCVEGPNKYALVWETASVACVRTVLPSSMISKPAHMISVAVPS